MIRNKRIIFIISIIIMIILSFAINRIFFTTIHLSNKSIILLKGESFDISADHNVEWESEDESIVKISKSGNMTAVATGTTKIHAIYLKNKASCKVKVEEPVLDSNSIEMNLDDEAPVTIKGTSITPEIEIKRDTIEYKNGYVRAIKYGNSKLIFKIKDRILTCKVKVKKPYLKDKTYKKGQKVKLILPNVNKNKKVEWESSDQNIGKIESADKEVHLECLNVGIIKLSALVDDEKYTAQIMITGDQGLKIKAKDMNLGDTQEIFIENYIPSYKITSKNVKEKDGKFYVSSEKRGKLLITADVDNGINTEHLTKEINVLDKKLNITEWSGNVQEQFVLTMQDGENVKYQYDETKLLSDNKGNFIAASPGETTIHVVDGDTDLICKVTIKENLRDLFIQSLRDTGNHINATGMSYSRNASSTSIENANEYNCAVYVCWALQNVDILPKDKFFWFNKKPHGAGFQYCEENPGLFEIQHPGIPINKCTDLQEGDIVGCVINGWAPHTCVFAGYDNEGHMTWYSGGSGDSKDGNFGPLRHKYYEQDNDIVYTCIRIRN